MQLTKLSDYKSTVWKGWAGNVGGGDHPGYLTDGHSMVLASAIRKSDREILIQRGSRLGRFVSAEAVEAMWKSTIETAVCPATPLGVEPNREDGLLDCVWLDSGSDVGIAVNAAKLAYLLRITKADRILTNCPSCAILLTRDDQPVALLMPISAGRINMTAAREVAAKLTT